jgi:arylsulfatase A-like enzyme
MEAGARLRLQAGGLGPGASLEVSWRAEPASGSRSWQQPVGSDPDEGDADEPIPAGRGTLCFRASGAPLFVGEPRLLAPEPAGVDPRPRWIVLTVVDALRADMVDAAWASGAMPTLRGLAGRGRVFSAAVAAGAHTRASVWSLLMGREAPRISPRLTWRPGPSAQPDNATVYANSNLFVTHQAASAGYHPVFLGNNSFWRGVPAFARYTNRGRPDLGTVDTIAELGRLFRRYADERVLLVYYVSSPHSESATPRRLFAEQGCEQAPRSETARCTYRARSRHADEALQAFEAALQDHSLTGSTFQLLTADHGEALGDGRRVETFNQGQWWRADEGHGATCHPTELDVPLVVVAPGLAPGVWREPVSTLDVVPTLLRVLGSPQVGKLDGEPLPLVEDRTARVARRLDSYGYCTQSIREGTTQFIGWDNDCWLFRDIGATQLARHRAELWTEGRLAATELDDPRRLAPWIEARVQRLAETLPTSALLLRPEELGSRPVVVTALAGRIVDYGPSGTITRLEDLKVSLGDDRRRLTVSFGSYRGRFRVATWPPLAPVRIDAAGGQAPLTFAGRLQLPLPATGARLAPEEQPSFWLTSKEPPERSCDGPCLRLWWQADGGASQATTAGAGHLERVLREWGYIR